jgi:hypothetical protein
LVPYQNDFDTHRRLVTEAEAEAVVEEAVVEEAVVVV